MIKIILENILTANFLKKIKNKDNFFLFILIHKGKTFYKYSVNKLLTSNNNLESQLKQRGWTEAKIKEWLKKPDKEAKNPFYPSASSMQLYLASKVKRQEKSKRFKEWLEKSKAKRKKLSKSLKETSKRKKQELIDYVNSLEIKIPKMPLKKLRE